MYKMSILLGVFILSVSAFTLLSQESQGTEKDKGERRMSQEELKEKLLKRTENSQFWQKLLKRELN